MCESIASIESVLLSPKSGPVSHCTVILEVNSDIFLVLGSAIDGGGAVKNIPPAIISSPSTRYMHSGVERGADMAERFAFDEPILLSSKLPMIFFEAKLDVIIEVKSSTFVVSENVVDAGTSARDFLTMGGLMKEDGPKNTVSVSDRVLFVFSSMTTEAKYRKQHDRKEINNYLSVSDNSFL